MRAASSQPLSDDPRARRRIIALLIVLIVHALLITALIVLGQVKVPPIIERAAMMVVNVTEERPPPPTRVTPTPAEQVDAAPSPLRATRTVAPPPKVPAPKAEPTAILDIDFDLAKAPPAPTKDTGTAVADGTASSRAIGPTYGPTLGKRTGPGGEPLYAAEWQVEPTSAQLAYYLPEGGAPNDSYGMIACRTVANYRVEDCFELEDTPGTRLAGTLRKAAWQFRVRPPREGGRPMIGAWVSIRITWTRDGSVR
ncbi:hypothetical protein [Glacieibacterium frigidum]|uniref:Protein TonB n=1 Tax=Glacieibacterium frigidum TaxID=2593303 RepID=A0A552UGT8_9SPHN|nr:hypothetical protein [Glacieibacterium frigidum]TRW17430.1 hypothetical protein FMM06_04495 [Glacieibacterium frigidum]